MISSYRSMRIILMFDLPSVEDYEKKEYSQFRKALLRNGYSMMQYSIYIKVSNLQVDLKKEIAKFKDKIPRDGNIRMIAITEKQYQAMEIVLGNKKIDEIYNNSERYVKI